MSSSNKNIIVYDNTDRSNDNNDDDDNANNNDYEYDEMRMRIIMTEKFRLAIFLRVHKFVNRHKLL